MFRSEDINICMPEEKETLSSARDDAIAESEGLEQKSPTFCRRNYSFWIALLGMGISIIVAAAFCCGYG